jgi:transposase
MDKPEAERLYDSGKEPTVEKLLEYDATIESLKEKIAQLERDSRNSSKPPSSDRYPVKPPESEKGKKKRKPGGQPQHKGTNRQLLPVEEVDKVIPLYPQTCDKCKKSLKRRGETVGEPFRWQTMEIPAIKPMVTEYQCHTLQCDCGCQTTAALPKEVAQSNFGPRLTGIIAYLSAVLHVSRRGAREFCETLLGVSISLGSTQNLLEHTSCAVEPIDTELLEALPHEEVLNGDETSWRDRWLWIFVAAKFIYFHVAKSRSSHVLIGLLGNTFKGILCVDRWGAYTKYHSGLMQICWAHLKRDFLGIIKIGEDVGASEAILFGETMEKLRKKLLTIWYSFKAGDISRDELIQKTKPIRKAIKRTLQQSRQSRQRRVRVVARNLLKRHDHLFTFVFYDGVEPTNNSAERGIRPAVQWRKVCFGNRSDNGAVLTSRLLTVTRTCWLQKRNPLEFLVDAITAYRVGSPAPSLLR